MKTKVLIFLLASFVCSMANADVLNIWKTTGEKVVYDFSQKPEIKYVDEMIAIITSNGTDKYSPDDLSGFTFNEKAYIDGVSSTITNGIQLRISESSCSVSGLKNGTQVNVTDVSGKTVFSGKADSKGVVTIPSNKMAKGVNIINADKSTFKTIKQ